MINKQYIYSGIWGVILFTSTLCVNASTVYIADDARNLYTVDTSTWAATIIGQTSSVMTDIAFDSTGNLYGITSGSSRLHSIDPLNANSSVIGSATIASANALAFSPSNKLYSANIFHRVYTLDTSDGSNVELAGVLPLPSSGDLEFDSSGHLYLSGYGSPSGGDKLLQLTVTGSTVSAITIGWFGVHDMHGLAYADNTMYGFSGQHAYSVSLSTGAATDLGAITGMAASSIAWGASTQPSTVPLPSALVLFASGLIGLARAKSRKKPC